MRKSARLLGSDFGINAQEMNYILKDQGFIEGEPGDYSLTEKGAAYASETFNRRGTGGSRQYNPEWTTRSWEEDILDVLDMSPETIQRARDGVAEYRKSKRVAANVAPVMPADDRPMGPAKNHLSRMVCGANWSNVAKGAGGVLLAIVAVYAAYKGVRYVIGWWRDTHDPQSGNVSQEEADSEIYQC